MNNEYKFLIDILKRLSTPNVNKASINVDTATITAEDCNSFHFSHSTFSLNSKKESLTKLIKLIIYHQ